MRRLVFDNYQYCPLALTSDFLDPQVTQEICDRSKLFTLMGSERLIILKSHPTDNPNAPSNVYMLTGHTNMM